MKLKKFIFTPGIQYLTSLALLVFVITALYNVQDTIGYETVSLILLFFILLMPLFGFGRGVIILVSFLAALGWNYYFIPPHFTFQIAKPEDFMMDVMFFIVAIVTGVFTSKLKTQESGILLRESRTNALYNLLKELSRAVSLDEVSAISVRNIKKVFGFDSVLIFSTENGDLSRNQNAESSFSIEMIDWVVADWCFRNKEEAGRGTKNLVYVDELYIPLIGARETLGCIGIKIPDGYVFSKDEKSFLKSFITQIITAAERELLNEKAIKSFIMAESDKLYKTLFNSISHELRTPITTIMSAASTIQDDNLAQQKEVRISLSQEIRTAAERLNMLVENLLDMTRLESGQLKIKPEWNDINDLINSSINQLQHEIDNHKFDIKTNIESSLFRFDFGLLKQAFINILHNCIIYTPDYSIISIRSHEDNNNCIIEISDNGKGFSDETLKHLFEKFFRGSGNKTGGTGLGLSIAKGFIEAHGGTITAKNKKPNGALFIITLPMKKEDGTAAENINS